MSKHLTLAYSNLNDNNQQIWPNGVHLKTDGSFPETNFYYVDDAFNTAFFTWDVWSKKYNIDNIPTEEKYVYPIHIDCVNFWNGKYLSTPLDIPFKVLDDIKNNRARIIFNMVKEGQGFIHDNRITLIKNQIKFLGLTNKHVFYMDSNIKTPSHLRSSKIKGLYYPYWESYNRPLDSDKIDQIVKNISLKIDRKYKFLSFNRRAADFRIALIQQLFDLGINKNSILTCGLPVSITNYSIKFSSVSEQIKKIILPITYDIEDLVSNNPLEVNFDAHLNSYINICCETFFDEDNTRLFFSEKIFKSIIALQPFILLGQYNSLHQLRQHGYKTFHPIINEDYDNEVNELKRFNMIINEVKRLNSMSNSELSEMMIQLLPILTHNASLYQTVSLDETRSHKVIEEIFRNWDQTL
jgi:dimeric dUTPase (all-alpha-NTP-PPase superfamily)